MSRLKCFLVEKTEKMHTEKCGQPGCTDPKCYRYRCPIFRRVDTGEEMTLNDATPGAMFFADWYKERPEYLGPDGKCLIVVLPNGHHWMVDGRASNCTRKGDKVHKCWCRHGEAPNITVDKVGNTCAAGAGSIAVEGYHGFLRNGYLESC